MGSGECSSSGLEDRARAGASIHRGRAVDPIFMWSCKKILHRWEWDVMGWDMLGSARQCAMQCTILCGEMCRCVDMDDARS